jgi:hypothetical protein
VLTQKFEDVATERDKLETEASRLRNDLKHQKQENAVLSDQVCVWVTVCVCVRA